MIESTIGHQAGDRLSQRVAAGALTATTGLGLLLITLANRELVFALAVAIAVAIEALLLVTRLAFAAALGGPSLRGVVLGVWGFFLTQSLFFLIPGGGAPPRVARPGDPFAAAHARALTLLDHGGLP